MLAGRGLPFRRMDEVWPAVGPIRRRVVGERVTDAPQRVVGLEGEVVGKPAQPVDEGEHVGDAVPSLGGCWWTPGNSDYSAPRSRAFMQVSTAFTRAALRGCPGSPSACSPARAWDLR